MSGRSCVVIRRNLTLLRPGVFARATAKLANVAMPVLLRLFPGGSRRERIARAASRKLRAAKATPASPISWTSQLAGTPVLVIGHDAFRAGAQILLHTLLKEWRRTRQLGFRLILVNDGALRADFEALGPTLVLSDYPSEPQRGEALRSFLSPKPTVVYSNTVVNGPLLDELRWLDLPVVTHVHELQKSIERWAPGDIIAATLRRSTHFIACSEPVAVNLRLTHGVAAAAITVIESFVDAGPEPDEGRHVAVDGGEVVVFGCGTADWRKGPDLFIDIAVRACPLDPRLRFTWIGAADRRTRHTLERQVREAGLERRIQLIGEVAQPRLLFPDGDLFLLSSREDPFPLVALEAAAAGLPIVCFDGTGGMPAFVGTEAGVVVPNGDTAAAAAAIVDLAADDAERKRLGSHGQRKVARENHVSVAAPRVAAVLENHRTDRPAYAVSVVVPNYNYGHLIERRLESIMAQTYPLLEIVVLDDASQDDSVERIRALEARSSGSIRLIESASNSGSVYRQWKKGVEEARGEFIWIAEADDLCHPAFLETVMSGFSDDAVVLSYCESRQMDADGNIIAPNYREYLAEVDSGHWNADFRASGIDEIRQRMSVKNTIPNVSAVVFRADAVRRALKDSYDEMLRYRVAGDWVLYLTVAAFGDVAFSAQTLNDHRRHADSVTHRSFDLTLLREIMQVQAWIFGRVAIDADVRMRGLRYDDELWRFFGLNRTLGAGLTSQPDLARLRSEIADATGPSEPRVGQSQPQSAIPETLD